MIKRCSSPVEASFKEVFMISVRSVFLSLAFSPLFLLSCYDDSELWARKNDYESRDIEPAAFCYSINSNIVSLTDVIASIEAKDYVKAVIPVYDNGNCIGYTLVFNERGSTTLYNNSFLTDALPPALGIKKDESGFWHWTIDDGRLLNGTEDEVIITGDIKQGVIPIQVKVEDSFWWFSHDESRSWSKLCPIVQNCGVKVRPIIEGITQNNCFVSIALTSGDTIQVSKKNPSDFRSEGVLNIENKGVVAYHKQVYDNSDYSYSCIDLWRSSLTRPFCEIPNGKVITTTVDYSATSRCLEYADNAEFRNSSIIDLDLTSSSYTLYNLEGNKDYYYRVYKDGEPYYLLNTGKFETIGTIRQLKIDANPAYGKEWLYGVRDLGGWDIGDERKIHYGILFRGPEFNHFAQGEEVVWLAYSGIKELKRLGVSVELDLRSNNEIQGDTSSILGHDVQYVNVPLDQWFYRLNIYYTVRNRANAFANAIRVILSFIKENKGVYIHCAGGCDRTGALCAIIEGLCGVSENDINHDYELSMRDRSREYYSLANGTKYDGDLKFAMEYIKGLRKHNNHIYVYYRGRYYDAEAEVLNFMPRSVSDPALINALNYCSSGSLKDRFRLLMELGGLSTQEMDELEAFLCA